MHFDRSTFLSAHAKGETSLNDFKFGTFIGLFPSDTLANMAVKGLSDEGHILLSPSPMLVLVYVSFHWGKRHGSTTRH